MYMCIPIGVKNGANPAIRYNNICLVHWIGLKYSDTYLFCTTVDRPSLAELVEVITPHYAAQWRRIGILLHITGGTLDAIEQQYPTNPNWCCDKMLETWIETDESASWNTLIIAINSLKNKIIAPNIRGRLHTFVNLYHACCDIQCNLSILDQNFLTF